MEVEGKKKRRDHNIAGGWGEGSEREREKRGVRQATVSSVLGNPVSSSPTKNKKSCLSRGTPAKKNFFG
jgi:hypothetical protein